MPAQLSFAGMGGNPQRQHMFGAGRLKRSPAGFSDLPGMCRAGASRA
jgi:hypothetical protein